MRFRIELESLKDQVLPWDYHYPLQSAFYRYLRHADPAYAKFLHQQGYHAPHNRRFKFFTFSDLAPLRTRTPIGYALRKGERLHFFFGSPIEDQLLTTLVTGFFRLQQHLTLATPNSAPAEFRIRQIKILDPEDFSSGTVTAICRSPVVVSVLRDDRKTEYLHALDPQVPQQLRQNLRRKYCALHHLEEHELDLDITITVDREYIERKGGDRSRAITRLRRILKYDDRSHRLIEVAIRGFIAPIHLHGSPELIQVAYDCGLGEKNSLGFGFWVPHKDPKS